MSEDLERRIRELEAKSLAQSIAISASLISIYATDPKGLENLRKTIVDGISRHLDADDVDREMLQMSLAEVEDLFRIMVAKEG